MDISKFSFLQQSTRKTKESERFYVTAVLPFSCIAVMVS